MTDLQKRLLEKNGLTRKAYVKTLRKRIRERYDIEDELAIQRQRDAEPEEFEEYNAFVEGLKAELKAEFGLTK